MSMVWLRQVNGVYGEKKIEIRREGGETKDMR